MSGHIMHLDKDDKKHPVKPCSHCGYAECPNCGEPLKIDPVPPHYRPIWVVPYWQQWHNPYCQPYTITLNYSTNAGYQVIL